MTARRPSRRAVLLGGAATLGGGTAAAVTAARYASDPAPGVPEGGAEVVVFHGEHQPGIATLPAQAHVRFVSLDLAAGSDVAAVRRLMRLLTDDAARMMAGTVPLGAGDPELPALPSRLTVTFGFGPGLFDAIGRAGDCPDVIRNLPGFATDRLEDRWSGGDLLVQVCSDDAVPLSYAVRRLVRDARGLARVRWTQSGFNPARGSEPSGTTPRNLMGQRDGSANAPAGSSELADVVWNRGDPPWLRGGSMLVLRRIRMDLDTWDDFGREGKELATARRLDTGAPITGGTEQDAPDPTIVDGQGFPVVAQTSHVALATHRDPGERMLRRGFSFDDGPAADGTPDAGLLFAAYQADAARAFVPVNERLSGADAMNTWITHIGSAAFAVPPGCAPGEFVGHQVIGLSS